MNEARLWKHYQQYKLTPPITPGIFLPEDKAKPHTVSTGSTLAQRRARAVSDLYEATESPHSIAALWTTVFESWTQYKYNVLTTNSRR